MRIIKAIALFPVYLLLQILRGIVHVLVAIYSRIGGLLWILLGILAILSIAFREWHQTAFIAALGIAIYCVLFAGAFLEVLLETAAKKII